MYFLELGMKLDLTDGCQQQRSFAGPGGKKPGLLLRLEDSKKEIMNLE